MPSRLAAATPGGYRAAMSNASIETKRPAPGEPVIAMINWGGLRALYIKEVRRFFKVQLQTVWGPAFSAVLLLVVFSIAFGRGGRLVMGVPFATFAAPGLIAMAMMQNAFANSSFSLLVGKMQGTIVDYLMPPLSAGELLTALVAAAVTRAVLICFALLVIVNFWPGHILPAVPWAVLYFGLMGAGMLSFLGVLTSIWAEKFAAVLALRDLLFDRRLARNLPRLQPHKPVLLRDFRLPLRLPWHRRQPDPDRGGGAARRQHRARRAVLHADPQRLEIEELKGRAPAA